MGKCKKITSLIVAVALLATSLFVGGVTASATSTTDRGGEFFCGFENYAVTRVNESAIPDYASLMSDGTYYAGSKHMKLSVSADSVSAFEIRDSKGFDTVSGEAYAVTFFYRSSAAVKYYIGTAQGNKVTATATAIKGGELATATSWTKVTLEVTLDKGRNEGFVPVMMVESSSAATVEFDNISLRYGLEDTVNIDNEFIVSTDTFPVLEGAKTPDGAANVWDGKTATAPSGSGTEDDPYKIATGANLYYVVKNGGGAGKYYVFTADIYLNNPIHVNWLTGSVNYGYTVKLWNVGRNTVQGIFDGQGYGVYGYYKQADAATYAGESTSVNGTYDSAIFGGVPDSGSLTIKNLTVDKMYVRENAGAGALVGYVGKGATLNVENCGVGQEVYLDGAVAGSFVCGVGQNNATVNITNCYSQASGYSHYGRVGFIGWTHWTNPSTVNLTNCYNAFGKLITEKRNTITATNCYEGIDGPLDAGVTTLTPANMKGSDVLTNSDKMSGLGSAYKTKTATFAEANKDWFVRLPEGTYFETDYSVYTYDAHMAPIDKAKVVSNNVATRGAYYKFQEMPDVTKIHVPASKIDEVKFGTAQYLFVEDYFDIRTSMIETKLETQPDSSVNYLIITDTHFATGTSQFSDAAAARQFELAIEMANKLDKVDFVVHDGDIVSGNDATAAECLEKLNKYLAAAKNCSKPVLILPGNHDDNSYGNSFDAMTLDEFTSKLISPDQWQETIIDQFVKREQEDGSFLYDIVQDKDPYNSAKTNSKYFYYDLKEKNTRVICINASDYGYHYDSNGKFAPNIKDESAATAQDMTYNGNNFWGYSDAQVKWLAEKALGTLPAGYNVIMLSHMRIDKEPTSNGGTRNYNNGTVMQGIINAYNTHDAYANASLNISADFTEDTGKIMIFHHGHEHNTAVGMPNESIANVWRFSSGTSNPYKSGSDSNKGISGPNARVKNENLGDIDVVSVSPAHVLRQSNGVGNVATNGTGLFFSTFTVQEGDINLDSAIDICDLVKYFRLDEAQLPAVQAKNLSLLDVRTAIINSKTTEIPEEPEGCKHQYDNNCDADCNLCGEERTVGNHVYDDDYDADCNECGNIREAEERPIEYWDGKTVKPTKTDNDGNILISRPSELAYIIANGGVEGSSSFILTNDIYLNDITKINWQTGEVSDGYSLKVWDYRNKHFNGGKIDGNGYVVYGLYYKEENPSYSSHPNSIGLIPRLAANANLEIKNLGVDYAYFNYYATAAAFIGTAMGANDITISNSYAGENVTIEAGNTGVFRGNTYGDRVKYMRLTDCYSVATTIPHTKNNGLIATQGDNYTGYKGVIITNCYNAKGPLSGGDNAAAVTTATNSYEAVASINNKPFIGVLVAENNMKGVNALSVMPLGDAYVATDSYPVLKTFAKTPATPDEPDTPEECVHTYYDDYHAECLLCGAERNVEARPVAIWDKSSLKPTVTDKDGSILIGKASELAYIIANGGGAGNTYKLIADIYLNDINNINWTTGVADSGYTANKWYDHGKTFQGTIDGDGHVIYGLYFNSPGSANGVYGSGLIPKVADAGTVTVKNLGVENAYVNSHSTSAFVGVAGDNTTVIMDNCYAGAEVTLVAGRDAGAFAGRIQGSVTITNCYSLASATGGTSSGLLGDIWAASTISNCYNAKGAVSYGTNTSYWVTATNCYEITKSQSTDGKYTMKTPTILTEAQMQGKDTAMSLGDAYTTVEDGYPTLKIFK